VVIAEPARPHLHLADRRSLGGSGARRRSTPPRRRRQRYPVLARRLAAQDTPPGAPVEVIQTGAAPLRSIASPACDQHEDRVLADTRGLADVEAVEQPLHVVRRDRLRDTGVVTLGRRVIPRSGPGAPCSTPISASPRRSASFHANASWKSPHSPTDAKAPGPEIRRLNRRLDCPVASRCRVTGPVPDPGLIGVG
jgi:hypothetical protein